MKKSILLVLVLGLWAPIALSLNIPRPTAPVVDSAGLVSAGTEASLNGVLQNLHKQRGIQMGVLTVKSLEGLSVESYSIKVAEAWKLGDAATDKGIILVVAPKERKVRIEVGQGMEGNVPDAYSKRVIDYDILPHFKSGNFESGIVSGVLGVIRYADPEYFKQLSSGTLAKQNSKPVSKKKNKLSIWINIIIFALFFFLKIGYLPFFGMIGGRRGGFGGGGFGGGGGSSWGGGGGGFSGGGSSGSW